MYFHKHAVPKASAAACPVCSLPRLFFQSASWGAHAPSRAGAGALASGSSALNREWWGFGRSVRRGRRTRHARRVRSPAFLTMRATPRAAYKKIPNQKTSNSESFREQAVQRPTSNVECRPLNSTLGVRCWALGVFDSRTRGLKSGRPVYHGPCAFGVEACVLTRNPGDAMSRFFAAEDSENFSRAGSRLYTRPDSSSGEFERPKKN